MSKPDLREVMIRHGISYMDNHHATLSRQQKRVILALARCQTGELGKAVYACDSCKGVRMLNCSCGNRHCSRCQGHKTIDWIKRQEDKHLPVEYHLVTFTIPQQLRPLVLYLREKAYDMMFDCAKQTIRDLLAWKYRIVVSGFSIFLHTWGDQMQFHPHLHVLLPSGGLNAQGQWVQMPKGFGLPVRAASKRWLGKLLKQLENEVGRQKLPKRIADKNFIVDNQAVGDGKATIRYLSRYVFRTAISDSRIKHVSDTSVIFSSKKDKRKTITLHKDEFMRRFLTHVLESGFTRVRHYGYLHGASKVDLNNLRILIYQFSELLLDILPKNTVKALAKPKPPACPCCGKPMRMVMVIRKLHPYNSSA